MASWVFVLEKGCEAPTSTNSCTHVPLGGTLCKDGYLRYSGEAVPGPPVQHVILATGYVYDFPFLDAEQVGMSPFGQRYIAPLYQHIQHARSLTLRNSLQSGQLLG